MSDSGQEAIEISREELPLLVLSELTPQNEKLLKFIGEKSAFWKQPPFPHERWLITVFAYLLEKGEENITEQDVKNIGLLLEHIASLKPEQILLEKPKNREGYLLLTEQERGTMSALAEKFSNPQQYFKENDNWRRHLLGVFRGFYLQLEKAKIFLPKNRAFEKEIASLREKDK